MESSSKWIKQSHFLEEAGDQGRGRQHKLRKETDKRLPNQQD